jgi:hypothetical protein
MRERYLRTGKSLDDGPICEHAILQKPDGSWWSKGGYSVTLRVLDPHQLDGPLFGAPARVFVRRTG